MPHGGIDVHWIWNFYHCHTKVLIYYHASWRQRTYDDAIIVFIIQVWANGRISSIEMQQFSSDNLLKQPHMCIRIYLLTFQAAKKIMNYHYLTAMQLNNADGGYDDNYISKY